MAKPAGSLQERRSQGWPKPGRHSSERTPSVSLHLRREAAATKTSKMLTMHQRWVRSGAAHHLPPLDWLIEPLPLSRTKSNVNKDVTEIDLEPLHRIVGPEVMRLIAKAPTKVLSRVRKSSDHLYKAAKLVGMDEEMGAIRLIAAEEELVVAIFEWLKLRPESVQGHEEFVRRFKNHYVKLAFHPVLAQVGFVLKDVLAGGITFDGLEDVLSWSVTPAVIGDRLMLQVRKENGDHIIDFNPLDLAISREDLTTEQVIDSLFEHLRENVHSQLGLTVREFVTARADYRNKLLYAGDAGGLEMQDTLLKLTAQTEDTMRDLLWCLAGLLTNTPLSKSWGLASQFIGVYRRVLSDCKLL